MLAQPSLAALMTSVAPVIGPTLPGHMSKPLATVDGKQTKTGSVLRKSAGKIWADATLAEWPAEDCRLFCGDLGNEVTDDLLANAFRTYKSFQKARVVRDKRTSKTKGYGFVSFGQPEDMIAALREVQGKYIGNRPVRLKKSQWRDKNVENDKHKLLLDFDFTTPAVSKSLKKFKKVKLTQEKKKVKK
eukprot:GEMP01082645.1.p1 GENE.GEMP01082645.1~~GEMP01082645.1.p1  ORF type:complete len:188 (+),score=26.30 GEMP01082645.1:46-609(+)